MTDQEKLNDARAQYHLLVTGQQAKVYVDGPSGERVEFTTANRADLRKYIAELEAVIAGTRTTSGPMRILM